MPTLRTLQKNGKSVMVTIPAEIRDAMDLMFGDTVAFVLGEGGWCGFFKVDVNNYEQLKTFMPNSLIKITHEK